MASAWMVIMSAPALAKSATWRSGRSTIRWTSSTHRRGSRRPATMPGPKVSGGTKWPSMMSTWITSAPAAIISCDLLAQAAVVGGEDRRRDVFRRAGSSVAPAVARSWRRMHPNRHEHAAPHELQLTIAVLDMRTMVECSPQLGQTETQLEAVQAVDAAVAARQVGRPQPRLAAVGAAAARGRACVAHRFSRSRRSAATKNPSLPWTCGRASRCAGRRGAPRPGSAAPGRSAAKSAWRIEEGVDLALVFGRRRSCRSSRRASRPGPAAPAAADNSRGLLGGERSATPAGVARQRRSGRELERAEAGARRVEQDAVEAPGPTARRGRRRPPPPPRRPPPSARRSAAAPAPGRRGARRPRARRVAAISAARCVVLPPGAAHRSSTRSPGLRVERVGDEHRRPRLGHEGARPPRAASRGRRTASSAITASGGSPGTRRGHRQRRGQRGGVADERVGPQRVLGRLVAARSSARAAAGPSASHQSSTIHAGIEWRSPPAAGVAVAAGAPSSRRALARRPGAGRR